MEYNLIINQAALRPWIQSKRINIKDALIIGFIRGLSVDDPEVRRHMESGYYLLTRSWILREMPLLNIKEDYLGRRLKHLKNVGLLDILSVVDQRHQYRLYGKLSKLYFQCESKAREKVDEVGENSHGENSELVEKSRGIPLRTPTVKTPIDHKIRDHKEADGAAPSGEAAADSQEQEIFAAAEFEAAIAKLPEQLRRDSEARRRLQKQADLPGLGPPEESGTEPARSETKGPSP